MTPNIFIVNPFNHLMNNAMQAFKNSMASWNINEHSELKKSTRERGNASFWLSYLRIFNILILEIQTLNLQLV